MKIRILIILSLATLLVFNYGCSTSKVVTPNRASVSRNDLTPPGFNGTNGAVASNSFVLTPFSETNVIYPSNVNGGFYIYALSIPQGWGYVTDQPPFEVQFNGTNLLLYNGEFGDSGTNTGTLTISNAYSPAYRFGVYAPGHSLSESSNYPLTMIGFSLPMQVLISGAVTSAHISIHGLDWIYGTYKVQSSTDLLSWSNFEDIPVSNATWQVDVPMTNGQSFYRVFNSITNQ